MKLIYLVMFATESRASWYPDKYFIDTGDAITYCSSMNKTYNPEYRFSYIPIFPGTLIPS